LLARSTASASRSAPDEHDMCGTARSCRLGADHPHRCLIEDGTCVAVVP
jgi:hypothetical protein